MENVNSTLLPPQQSASTDLGPSLFVWQECARRVHLTSEKRIISELKETSSWRAGGMEDGDARGSESRLNSHMRHNALSIHGKLPIIFLGEGKSSSNAVFDKLEDKVFMKSLFICMTVGLLAPAHQTTRHVLVLLKSAQSNARREGGRAFRSASSFDHRVKPVNTSMVYLSAQRASDHQKGLGAQAAARISPQCCPSRFLLKQRGRYSVDLHGAALPPRRRQTDGRIRYDDG